MKGRGIGSEKEYRKLPLKAILRIPKVILSGCYIILTSKKSENIIWFPVCDLRISRDQGKIIYFEFFPDFLYHI